MENVHFAIEGMYSGEISATSHTIDFPQKVAEVLGNPRLFQGKLGWWNIISFGQIHGRNMERFS